MKFLRNTIQDVLEFFMLPVNADLWAGRVLFFAIVAVAIGIIITGGVLAEKCNSKPPITPEQVQRINSKDKAEALGALNEVVEQNAAVVSTVNGRNTLANVEIEQRSAEQDARVLDAAAKVQSIRNDEHHDVTSEELEGILLGMPTDDHKH